MYNNYSIIIAFIMTKIFRRKDSSLERIIEIKTTLAQMRRVIELKSIFGFRIYLHVYSKNNTII